MFHNAITVKTIKPLLLFITMNVLYTVLLWHIKCYSVPMYRCYVTTVSDRRTDWL